MISTKSSDAMLGTCYGCAEPLPRRAPTAEPRLVYAYEELAFAREQLRPAWTKASEAREPAPRAEGDQRDARLAELAAETKTQPEESLSWCLQLGGAAVMLIEGHRAIGRSARLSSP